VPEWLLPRTVHAIREFFGQAGYYRRFIQGYGDIATPLTALLHKDGLKWTPETEAVFRSLQRKLTSAPIVQLSNFDQDFTVECSAGPIVFYNQ
jgi:hypothetical protein